MVIKDYYIHYFKGYQGLYQGLFDLTISITIFYKRRDLIIISLYPLTHRSFNQYIYIERERERERERDGMYRIYKITSGDVESSLVTATH